MWVFLEEVLKVLLNGEAGSDRLQGGVGLNLGCIEVKFLSPHQPCFGAHLHDPLEESPEDLKSIAIPDPGEAGVVGQGFVQIISEIPSVPRDGRQLPA